MNRRDVILFGLAAAAVGAFVLLGRRGGSSPVIGRIGSTITLGSDPAAIADAIQEAAASTPPTPTVSSPPSYAFQIGGQWMVPGPNPRFLTPWVPTLSYP